ncbi:hypothetical protein DL96DRAFT_256093 [Flagelloscypha sp. PMI_526]|nr:hypothetical protein DL96DRAFT_256093 [Flagelloscypha sp. PMI_526]
MATRHPAPAPVKIPPTTKMLAAQVQIRAQTLHSKNKKFGQWACLRGQEFSNREEGCYQGDRSCPRTSKVPRHRPESLREGVCSPKNITNFLESCLVKVNKLWTAMKCVDGGASTDVVENCTLAKDLVTWSVYRLDSSPPSLNPVKFSVSFADMHGGLSHFHSQECIHCYIKSNKVPLNAYEAAKLT